MVCVGGSMIEAKETQASLEVGRAGAGYVPRSGSWRETRSSSVVWGNLDPRPIIHWYGLRSAELQRGSFFGPAEPPSVTRHVVTISVAELVQIGAAGRTLRV